MKENEIEMLRSMVGDHGLKAVVEAARKMEQDRQFERLFAPFIDGELQFGHVLAINAGDPWGEFNPEDDHFFVQKADKTDGNPCSWLLYNDMEGYAGVTRYSSLENLMFDFRNVITHGF